jgi:hypothetical protein
VRRAVLGILRIYFAYKSVAMKTREIVFLNQFDYEILFHLIGSDGLEFLCEPVDHSVHDGSRKVVRAPGAFPLGFRLVQRPDGQHGARRALWTAEGR